MFGEKKPMKTYRIPKDWLLSKDLNGNLMQFVWQVHITLRITGPCYRGVRMCIAGVWDLQTTSFEIP